MSVQCDAFLDCAKRLLTEHLCTEMNCRNSSSRAYYYLFHKIRKKFRQHSQSHFRDRAGDNQEAVRFLMRIGETTLADRVNSCFITRTRADYDIDDSFSKPEADDQISEVESIAVKIDEIDEI